MAGIKRNVYDFDGTIYDGDSTIDFYIYCLKSNKKVLLDLPKFFISVIRYKLNIIDRSAMKQEFYCFLKRIRMSEQFLDTFWAEKHKNIKQWYLGQKKESDIIVSASPEFLLKPIARKLNVDMLIASKVDMYTGMCIEKNCRGEEKVNRLKTDIGDIKVYEFYSDNRSDDPLANIAAKAFLVRGNRITDW